MTETAAPVVAAVVAKSPLKKKPAAPKTKKSPGAHPTTAVMVSSAIKELKEKKGSSLPAIKKYMVANYKVDAAKLAPFIRKFLKAAVAKGVLVQTNGNGASGHFKLAADADTKKPAVKKTAAKKKPVAKKPAKAAAGTPSKKRKLVTAKKPKSSEPAAKKAKKPAAPKKTPVKTKKTPATKVKAPKAKKSLVKKVAPKKK